MDKGKFLALGHWLIALLVFSLYGVQVCPFLEAQTPIQLFAPIVLGFCLAWLGRSIGLRYIANLANEQQVGWQLKLDLVLFISIAAFVVAYNSIFYDSPWDSNLKVLLGLACLGFFVSLDLALYREGELAAALERASQHLPLPNSLVSFRYKFALFAAASIAVLVAVIFLVVNKDLDWLVKVGGQQYSLAQAQRYIVLELGFVLLVVLAYVLRVIHSYSKNLQNLLDGENQSLALVQQGQFDTQVTISSRDEFGQIAERTNAMIASLKQNTQALQQTRDIAIHSLASLAETRDNETGAHILRTKYYVKALAEELYQSADFDELLDKEIIELIYKSAPLHDIGKVGVPDAILLKPGQLDQQQWQVMRQHPEIGAAALAEAERQFSREDTAFLRYAKEIALCHHEKWDGSGYPAGLAGKVIPLSARLMALADVYDALISKRVYKPAFSHQKAKQIIEQGKGAHFDPAVVDAFCRCEQQFVEIAARYSDLPGKGLKPI